MSDRNYHHGKVVDALRALDPIEYKVLRTWVDDTNDDDIIKSMFRNVRIDDGDIRGGRLSKSGATILKQLFTFWEIKLNHPLTARQQLRFSRACRLPYYHTDRILLSFENEVGIWLSMIQGDIDLMDNVLPEY